MAATSSRWRPREHYLALFSFVSVTVLIVTFLLRDASAFVNSDRDELIGHLGASGGFTLAAAGAYLVLRSERPPLLGILVAGAAITVAAELAQGLVPHRVVALGDIATGFGGVLLAAVGIEIILLRCSLLVSQRVHTVIAAIASIILAVMLVFDLAPDTLQGASPDGETCPFTTIDGSGQRITIGADPSIDDGCLQTAAGGLGLFGPDDPNTLNDESVLLSSPLDVLADRVIASSGLSITTEFTTGDFSDDVREPGVLLMLRSNGLGDLLQIRTRDQAAQVIAPNFLIPYRTLSYTAVLQPVTRYQMRTELTATELRVYIDDELVSINTVDAGWLDALANADSDDELTLYLANAPWRGFPFNGVIEWVEIDS